MYNIKKLIVIIIRLQALAFILQAIALWSMIAIGIVAASLQSVPSQFSNYESSLILSIVYMVIGLILYIRSRSLAVYFINSIQEDKESAPEN